MNRLLLVGLLGAGLYWLLRQPSQPAEHLLDDATANDDMAEGGTRRISERPDPLSEEDMLDEAIKESFPASDPPALSSH